MNQLKEGDKAPDFKAVDQFGKEVSLKKLAGSKIILYFYPKDSTPGCTVEACNLRDNYDELIKKGFFIIGVSADSDVSHKKFMNKYSLPFSLIPDTDKEILNAYGVWGEKKFMGRNFMGIIRTTFIISEKGIIEKIITKVDTKNHTEQIYKTINL